jgi:hypothetical protein
MKKSLLILGITNVLLSLSACSDPHPPPAATAPATIVTSATPATAAPIIINNTPAHGSGLSDMLVGGAMGYMLASSANSTAPRAAPDSGHTTVNKTVINKTVVVQQLAAPPSPGAKAPPTAPPPAPAMASVAHPVKPDYTIKTAYAAPVASPAYRAAASPVRIASTYSAPARSYAAPPSYSSFSSARR